MQVVVMCKPHAVAPFENCKMGRHNSNHLASHWLNANPSRRQQVLQESFVDTKDYARASITFAMTDRHLLAGRHENSPKAWIMLSLLSD